MSKINEILQEAVTKEFLAKKPTTEKEKISLKKKIEEKKSIETKKTLINNTDNAFVNAAQTNTFLDTQTLNGMPAMSTTMNSCLDLFASIGGMRGRDIIPSFKKAYEENPELALRIALWARDAREGAGERKIFRDILNLITTNPKYSDAEKVINILEKIPEIGRFDDLLCVFENNSSFSSEALKIIDNALSEKNGLCAKWMPRQGKIAYKLRKHFNLTPKQWRKLLVYLTDVVETKMCEQEWFAIDFAKVPSVAFSRYTRTFKKHSPAEFEKFIKKVEKGEAKINASAIYPYQVIKNVRAGNAQEADLQWKALPDYCGDNMILPMVDTSGSMSTEVSPGLTAYDISQSLGLYLSSKNKSTFKDVIMTFSSNPYLFSVKGTLSERLNEFEKHAIVSDTNIEKAVKLILDTAVTNKVPKEDMPKMLLIISDMQFNQGVINPNATSLRMINAEYIKAGYDNPKIVYWCVNSYGNFPVKANEKNVSLVSGFSPAILKDILKTGDFNPANVMLETIMKERYKI